MHQWTWWYHQKFRKYFRKNGDPPPPTNRRSNTKLQLHLISPKSCIYASVNWVSIGSDNGLLPIIKIQTYSFKKMHLKISSEKHFAQGRWINGDSTYSTYQASWALVVPATCFVWAFAGGDQFRSIPKWVANQWYLATGLCLDACAVKRGDGSLSRVLMIHYLLSVTCFFS